MKKLISILTAVLLLSACASTHPGTKASTASQPLGINLVVSADLNSRYSDEANLFWDVTFENKDSTWARFKEVRIEFPESSPNSFEIPTGGDLNAWISSTDAKLRVSDHNTSVATSALMLGGALVLAGSGGDSGAAGAGAAALVAGSGIDSYQSISRAINQAEDAVQVPESHLLSRLSIPGKGLGKKWIVISTPDQNLGSLMRLSVTDTNDQVAVYDIKIADPQKVKMASGTRPNPTGRLTVQK